MCVRVRRVRVRVRLHLRLRVRLCLRLLLCVHVHVHVHVHVRVRARARAAAAACACVVRARRMGCALLCERALLSMYRTEKAMVRAEANLSQEAKVKALQAEVKTAREMVRVLPRQPQTGGVSASRPDSVTRSLGLVCSRPIAEAVRAAPACAG